LIFEFFSYYDHFIIMRAGAWLLVVGEAVMVPFSMMQQGVGWTSRRECGTATSAVMRRLILQAIVMIGCGLGVIVVGQRLCLVSPTCGGPQHHRYL
jgi:hypothetical protein